MTCSAIDSSALLAEIAIIKTSNSNNLNECETQTTWVSPDDLRNTWSVLSRQYIEEYEECIESIILSETGMYATPFAYMLDCYVITLHALEI